MNDNVRPVLRDYSYIRRKLVVRPPYVSVRDQKHYEKRWKALTHRNLLGGL